MRVSYWQDSDLEGMPDWWELRYALDSRRNDALVMVCFSHILSKLDRVRWESKQKILLVLADRGAAPDPGQSVQLSRPQARKSPKTGEALRNSGSFSRTSASV